MPPKDLTKLYKCRRGGGRGEEKQNDIFKYLIEKLFDLNKYIHSRKGK